MRELSLRKEAKLIELGSKNWPSKTVDKIIKDQLGDNKELGVDWRTPLSSLF